MPRSERLVREHLEGVHWSVLKDYLEVVNEFIRGQAGVYALYKGKKLYYVGLAVNLQRRLNAHLLDRHKDDWDRFSVYMTASDEHMKELESLLLRIMSPKGNIQGGRFNSSENLNPAMNKRIRRFDAERRRDLVPPARFGRTNGAGSSRQRVSNGGPSREGVGKGRTLRGWHKDWQYRAFMHATGRVTYDGKLFDSPSAAAAAATRASQNGWRFWHYKDSKGHWSPISALKK